MDEIDDLLEGLDFDIDEVLGGLNEEIQRIN